LNKVTQDLRYAAQNLEMTGYVHSEQRKIAKFSFVQCLTKSQIIQKGALSTLQTNRVLYYIKFAWFVASMDWIRLV